MPTVPRLIERRANRVDLSIRKNPDVLTYELQAADTLDTAFAGATAMFTVPEGASFRSYAIRQKRWGRVDENNRSLTRIMYDPSDYAGTGNIPLDAHTSFLRVVETSKGAVVRPAGPILVVPPPDYLQSSRPALGVSGTAPSVAPTGSGVPPVGAMHFVLPRYSDGVRIHNTGGSDLLVSYGAGIPEFAILAGTAETLADAHITDVFVHGDGGATTFTMLFSLVNGLQE